jgi:hypothetical protein
VERAFPSRRALHDQPRALVDDDRHQRWLFLARMTIFVSVQTVPSSFIRLASSSRTRWASAPSAACAGEPVVERMLLLEALDLLDLETGLGKEAAPFVLGVVTHVRGVAELLRLLVPLARVERVLDHDEPVADALEFRDRRAGCPRSDAVRSA